MILCQLICPNRKLWKWTDNESHRSAMRNNRALSLSAWQWVTQLELTLAPTQTRKRRRRKTKSKRRSQLEILKLTTKTRFELYRASGVRREGIGGRTAWSEYTLTPLFTINFGVAVFHLVDMGAMGRLASLDCLRYRNPCVCVLAFVCEYSSKRFYDFEKQRDRPMLIACKAYGVGIQIQPICHFHWMYIFLFVLHACVLYVFMFTERDRVCVWHEKC